MSVTTSFGQSTALKGLEGKSAGKLDISMGFAVSKSFYHYQAKEAINGLKVKDLKAYDGELRLKVKDLKAYDRVFRSYRNVIGLSFYPYEKFRIEWNIGVTMTSYITSDSENSTAIQTDEMQYENIISHFRFGYFFPEKEIATGLVVTVQGKKPKYTEFGYGAFVSKDFYRRCRVHFTGVVAPLDSRHIVDRNSSFWTLKSFKYSHVIRFTLGIDVLLKNK
ncbi:MAG: hypothetical protein P8P29_03710 [Flavobacteriaceae bacterium]|nr:hypothetical protein [Flavobacteriaceae bacterium]